MDYLGVAILGAIYGFGLCAVLGINRQNEAEDEIARLNTEIGIRDGLKAYKQEITPEQKKRIHARELKRSEREFKRGHGRPAGEA